MKTAFFAFLFLFLAMAKAQDDIKIAFTQSMHPYFIEQPKGGIEYEVINAAFNASGATITGISNLHFKRALILLSEGKVDAIVVNAGNSIYAKVNSAIYASERTLDYVDCAVSLKENKLTVKSMRDLASKKIVAFKPAQEVLGENFGRMARANPNYSEAAGQHLHPKLLLNKRVDFVVSDKNVFISHLRNSEGEEFLEKNLEKMQFHHIVPKTPRNLRFINKKLMKRFNNGLKIIKNNGTYDRILRKYRNNYFSEC